MSCSDSSFILEKYKKKSDLKKLIFKAKTTSALTSLIATILICQTTAYANPTTSSNSLTISTNIADTCSIANSNLIFGTYTQGNDVPALEATPAAIVANCSTGSVFSIKMITAQDGGGRYNLITGDGATDAKQLWFRLYSATAAGGTRITGGVTFLTATGSGSTATAGYLYGQLLAEQTGRDTGSYTKTLSIAIVYGN
jgi:hypothetical protein